MVFRYFYMQHRSNRCQIRLCLCVFLTSSMAVTLLSLSSLNRYHHHRYPCDSNIQHMSNSLANQIVIFVRTSFNCHSRLSYLLQSWIPADPKGQKNLYLITDDRSKYPEPAILNFFPNTIETQCPNTHNRFDLCCKTAKEFELFYDLIKSKPHYSWMCRFDDDQYLNKRNLYQYLSQFNSSKPYYLGRTSINYPLRQQGNNRTFRFATYGAGVCFSRSLLEQLRPYINSTNLPHQCEKRGISDDAYIGFVVEILLNISLISDRDLFHSHLEKLNESFRRFTVDDITRAITLGFAWDRYKLDWLPVIHQLIELVQEDRMESANRLWSFLRTYEMQHPENLTNDYDRSCLSYRKLREENMQKRRNDSPNNSTTRSPALGLKKKD